MRLKITFLLLLFSGVVLAQNLDDLKKDTKTLYEATYNMAFETILDYTHPTVFKLVKREDMYTMLDTAFQNDAYRLRYVYTTPHFSYSEISSFNNSHYCVITYENAMRITYENKIESEESQKKIMATLQKNFPDASIRFEKDRNAFYIVKNDKLLAISDDETNGKWKFMNVNPNYKELLEAVITENVRKQLGL
ncbi:hypothetical protein LZZ90_06315 [Flavobacterium sp. SM15]|uniref:hypothetical protein n=1 Tax=Flavobacterium sp. SM15 TaxID=2908005 RepID=UPI001EDC893F|nr:hypothetical protein [Flavobacterium sp. SM15]MCG2611115.1 hypothetical protein [Flavobacterium sp. SM15]